MSQFILWSAVAYVIFAIAGRFIVHSQGSRPIAVGSILIAIVLVAFPMIVYTRWIQAAATTSRPPELKKAAFGFALGLVITQLNQIFNLLRLSSATVLPIFNRDLPKLPVLNAVEAVSLIVYSVVVLFMLGAVGRWVSLTTQGKEFGGNQKFKTLMPAFFTISGLLMLLILFSMFQPDAYIPNLVCTELGLAATLILSWGTQRFMEQRTLS